MERRATEWNSRRWALWIAVLVMVGASLGPLGMVRDARGMICCGGGGGGCWSAGTPIELSASVSTNPTNATVTYQASSSSQIPFGMANLYWGPSTSYPYTAVTGQGFGTAPTGSATDFLNYLKPSTTYYYKITATDTCDGTTYSGSTTGSWATGSDGMTSISGTIYDMNGNVAPANIYVALYCQGSSALAGWDLTSSTGQYSFTVYQGSYLGWVCPGNYVVSVDNYPVDWAQELNVWSAVWSGHWNETIEVYDAQLVNFYLPTNYVSGWVPMTYDFATNSQYVEFSVSSSSTFETQESYSLSVQGAINGVSVGGGTSYSATATTNVAKTLNGVEGDSFIIQQEYVVTGTAVFDAATRLVSLFPDFFEPSGSMGSGPTSVGDWLPQPACNSDPGVVYCEYQETSTPNSYSMTDGGSYTLSSSFNMGVSVPISLPGIGVTGSVSDSYTTSFATTSSTSYTVSFTVASPSTTCYGFVYEFQGDGSSQYGVVAHVWGLGSEPSSDC